MGRDSKRTRKKKKLKKKNKGIKWIKLAALVVIAAFVIIVGKRVYDSLKTVNNAEISKAVTKNISLSEYPEIDVELLTINPYSRPGTPLEKINGIVIHWTANPGSSAIANRDYFESLKDNHITSASSHFIIGLDGEIVQCIPSSEISYASNDRNNDTLSIECCIPDETGKFNDATYSSMVYFTAWLCKNFNVDVDNVIRHYDVTGKDCPKYFVENEDKWLLFKQDIRNYIAKYSD
ncbi:N-acetylmuramoyl-L-alanine amidase [Acetitomaculum ruminis DSM 5522]|uniref:N-acetylmuramoyl-L-alanine amidase n=1 Tax=Acetitomaculum ruminis DSM 5522 TaxID=1120918 RepID=A0A1I0XNU3_9FIRM|nr:peptidoglycan recognition family protein [Acetitomaculum ruminis]SFB02574.1 N-acetylmuramoyl-L-alanine amidase [Acetitomaculum ruminis DSM 5522]